VIVKAVTFLLLGLAVLGMIGGLRLRRRKQAPKLAATCPRCGRPRIGKGDCGCGAPAPRG
jgi:hypothetical protein